MTARQLQTPDYPGDFDGEPGTDGETDQTDFEGVIGLQLTDQHTRESIHPDDQINQPLPHSPNLVCYRNAVLAALFNISPFLNFLELVATMHPGHSALIDSLDILAIAFRGRTPEPVNRDGLKRLMAQSWRIICDVRPQGGGRTWGEVIDPRSPPSRLASRLRSPQAVDEFLQYLFPRISAAEIDEDLVTEVGGDWVPFSHVFQRLFWYQCIGRIRFSCGHGKQRENPRATNGPADNLFFVNTDRDQIASLSDLITERLIDTSIRALDKICPECHQGKIEIFYKFLYMPETFFVQCDYREDTSSNNENARVEFPDVLDLSRLRNDPNMAADPDNSDEHATFSYKLQSIVAYSVSEEYGGHFIAYLRRNDDNWDRIDDKPVSVTTVTLAELRESRNYRARILMYVRDRPVREAGSDSEGDTDSDTGGDRGSHMDGDGEPAPATDITLPPTLAAPSRPRPVAPEPEPLPEELSSSTFARDPSTDARAVACTTWTLQQFQEEFAKDDVGLRQLPSKDIEGYREVFLGHLAGLRQVDDYLDGHLKKWIREAGVDGSAQRNNREGRVISLYRHYTVERHQELMDARAAAAPGTAQRIRELEEQVAHYQRENAVLRESHAEAAAWDAERDEAIATFQRENQLWQESIIAQIPDPSTGDKRTNDDDEEELPGSKRARI